MDMNNKPDLTSAEIANLWTSYMNESLSVCILKFFVNTVNDKEIQPSLAHGLRQSQQFIQQIADIFNREHLPVPQGLTDLDVNPASPSLYSDSFMLLYLRLMSGLKLRNFSTFIPKSTRQDVIDFFGNCHTSVNQLYSLTTNIALSKGMLIKPPYIAVQEKVEFVHKQNFIAGWFGDRRPLSSIEISYIASNIERNAISRTLVLGFSQAAKLQHVRDYLVRGKNMSSKHIEVFGSLLTESDIPTPMTWDTGVTQSSEPPFSDKLMMYHALVSTIAEVCHYGTSLSVSLRRDLASHYTRLIGEMMKYMEDGLNIMVDHGWLEQPPQILDRNALVKS